MVCITTKVSIVTFIMVLGGLQNDPNDILNVKTRQVLDRTNSTGTIALLFC